MKNKLVSVNVTTYNRSNLLSRCIKSILRQSYKEIEIVIVDDCSSDNTEEVVRSFQSHHECIKYFRHSNNKGNAFARNTAIKKCNGYYVAFMDDDDEWIDSNKLQKQVAIFESNSVDNLGIVCSGIKRHHVSGKVTDKKPVIYKNIKKKVLGGGLIHNSTVLTKKNIILKVGGFDEKMLRGIDSEFFRRMIVMHNYNVHFMEDLTCGYYEDSPNRITTNNNNVLGLKNTIKTHKYILKKYSKYYFLYPQPLLVRLKIMLILYFKLIQKSWFENKKKHKSSSF